jgi:hypothetical protein
LSYDKEMFKAGLVEDQHADMAVGETNEDEVDMLAQPRHHSHQRMMVEVRDTRG